MNEKVLKVLIARLEESAIFFQLHKNDVWSEELDNNREAILKAFKEQQKEIERCENYLNELGFTRYWTDKN